MRTDPPVTTLTSMPHTFWTTSTPSKPWYQSSRAEGGKRKMYALQPNVIPETIVSSDKQVIRQFVESGSYFEGYKAGEEFFI